MTAFSAKPQILYHCRRALARTTIFEKKKSFITIGTFVPRTVPRRAPHIHRIGPLTPAWTTKTKNLQGCRWPKSVSTSSKVLSTPLPAYQAHKNIPSTTVDEHQLLRPSLQYKLLHPNWKSCATHCSSHGSTIPQERTSVAVRGAQKARIDLSN